jgi:acetyl esterase/lipase
LSSLAASLSDAGIAVWSIEFRRVGDPGGGWPGTFLDVARASDYARTLAQDFAIDPKRIVAVGHSSGGHLAAWLAGRRGINPESVLSSSDPLQLKAVVALAAVLDMADAVEGQLRAGDTACQRANIEVMGGRPAEVPDHYRSGSPIELVPTDVPSHIVVGARDNPHRIAQLRRYATRATAAGDDVDMIELPNSGHFDVINPASPDWHTIRDTILRSVASP